MVSALTLSIVIFAVVFPVWGSRIVGGEDTSVEEYPGIVQVDHLTTLSWDQRCGGNILTSWHILSAAHCLENAEPGLRRIRAGATERNTGGSVIVGSKILNHPDYEEGSHDANIGILVLAWRLTFSPTIQQVAIIGQGQQVPDETPVVTAGWGAVSESGDRADVLQKVGVYTVNRDQCREAYAALEEPLEVTDNMICSGLWGVGGKDACIGDAGGPVYYDLSGFNILVGIVSWGHGCASPDFPGVNTAVSSYTDWIIEMAAEV